MIGKIAGFVGCSRVTVTRHLKELTKAGIIDIVNRHIVIKDMDALSGPILSLSAASPQNRDIVFKHDPTRASDLPHEIIMIGARRKQRIL